MQPVDKRFRLVCRSCSNAMVFPAAWAGRKAGCPVCGEAFSIPYDAEPVDERETGLRVEVRTERSAGAITEWDGSEATSDTVASRARRRKVLVYVGLTLLAGSLVAGWMYARHVYRTDFSAAGRMKKRGFGRQLDDQRAPGPAAWDDVRRAERNYSSGDSGLLSAISLLEAYRRALDEQEGGLGGPMRAYVLNNAAWFLATTVHVALRDPTAALEMAREAVRMTKGSEPMYLDTLAEARFRLGRVREALETEYRALEIAPDAPYLQPQIRKFRKALDSEGTFDATVPPRH